MSIAPLCLWLAVDIKFWQGGITGPQSAELWRAVIKNELRAHKPADALRLLEPLRHSGTSGNVDCPGLIVECSDLPGQTRVLLKFLGAAFEYAPAVLLALEAALHVGVGQRGAVGSILALHAWSNGQWRQIQMPLTPADLTRWIADPALLAGYEATPPGGNPTKNQCDSLLIHTRSRWVWRSKGELVKKPPSLKDLLILVTDRTKRVRLAWGEAAPNPDSGLAPSVAAAAESVELIDFRWALRRRTQRDEYPSHGHEGWLHYRGAVTQEILHLLMTGSFLHIGQQTAIGLGGYWVEVKP